MSSWGDCCSFVPVVNSLLELERYIPEAVITAYQPESCLKLLGIDQILSRADAFSFFSNGSCIKRHDASLWIIRAIGVVFILNELVSCEYIFQCELIASFMLLCSLQSYVYIICYGCLLHTLRHRFNRWNKCSPFYVISATGCPWLRNIWCIIHPGVVTPTSVLDICWTLNVELKPTY